MSVLQFIRSNRAWLVKAMVTTRNLSCWSCGKNQQTPTIFCEHCNAIQKPDKNKTYFEIMDLKESYDLNLNDLTKKYKEMQKCLHPDKFAQRSNDELIISEEYSSLINEAYTTLLEPLTRGIYLLNLKGHQFSENIEVGNDILIEIMEKNEEVENATTDEQILKLNDEIKIVINDLSKQLSMAFFDGNLNVVSKVLAKMKYYTSIDRQIQAEIRNRGIIQ